MSFRRIHRWLINISALYVLINIISEPLVMINCTFKQLNYLDWIPLRVILTCKTQYLFCRFLTLWIDKEPIFIHQSMILLYESAGITLVVLSKCWFYQVCVGVFVQISKNGNYISGLLNVLGSNRRTFLIPRKLNDKETSDGSSEL